ncbi:hypothetical protein [Reinekea sp.]|uniref:cupin domain-containing protein n=1 Tax=Reinekea sp. TaxID=1970455 RepID=UPI0033906EFB
MTRPSINIDADAFLSTYWQQSPQLLRQAFNPEQLISGDELAGLAMEPEVESRLIKHLPESDEWLLRHGPFAEEDFAELGPENWTLLVQAVDHWVPEIRTLLSGFNFLPQWRIDDIMVSFATKGVALARTLTNMMCFYSRLRAHVNGGPANSVMKTVK